MALKVTVLFIFLVGCNFEKPNDWMQEFSPSNYEKKSGYIVYYFDLVRDCHSCIKGLELFNELQESYPEIGFYAMLRGNRMPVADFKEEMKASGIFCETAWDKKGTLRKRFQLENGPFILFLNNKGEMVASRKAHYSLPVSRQFFEQLIEHI